jgi:tryptophanase
MKYEITSQELKCINILIRSIQEAINRKAYTEKEIDNIIKTVELLSKRQNIV